MPTKVQLLQGCASGNARSIAGLSQGDLIAILENDDEFPGTKLAAFKVLRGQKERDEFGTKLLQEHLSKEQLECVLMMMSKEALQSAIKNPDLPTDPVKIAASLICKERQNAGHGHQEHKKVNDHTLALAL